MKALPVHFAHDRVDGRDDGDAVGDQAAPHHVGEGLQVDERRRPDVQAVRTGAAVGNDVAAQLAPGGLDGDVDLAFGHLEALGEDLEVVDERFHGLVDASPG